ncbi:hypothetical protein D9758_006532 [Tetrapyrgos nigripes]|uniref:Uncharacterized protein n=1 Tax=Tetrapyrgos nigripes TaxID=182062 RepID=A0A8H5GLA7_9AGAR|nr:hypothetical protein D9758_006532 [Tetrapyrgos nigripes]
MDPPVSAVSALTTLYKTALDSIASPGGDEDIRGDLRLLLGFVKFTLYHNCYGDWKIFLQSLLESYTGANWSSKLPVLCDKLSSLLVYDESQCFQLIHKSLDDFLMDHNRCGDDWFLDHKIYKSLTSACSKLLMSYLGNACMSNSVSSEKTATQYALQYCSIYYSNVWKTGPRDNNFDIEAEVSHLLQWYLLRWVFYAVTKSSDFDRWQTVGFLSEGLLNLSENLDKTRNDPFAQLIHEAHRLSSALYANCCRARKVNTILYFFHFLCAAYRKDMKILHQWYMPAFVQMAGCSQNYGDIIEAIKALNDYPPLLSKEDTTAENIEIIGIFEVIEDEMLADVDWDLKKSWLDY